jgi:prepilin peptidase CpaA
MMTIVFCMVFPVLLLFAAWHDVSTMTIPNWISILLAVMFVPAALSAGLPLEQIGAHFVFSAIVLLVCAALFYLNVFGGGDAKVIAAASLWTGLGATGTFVIGMALSGGALAGLLILMRRMTFEARQPWLARLKSPEEGAPYAVAIAIGALFAAPGSPVIAAGMARVLA